MTRIAPYQAKHFEGVDRLWRTVFPDDPARNQAHNAIPAKLELNDGLFWVALTGDNAVIGTIMAGWDGHRGWLYAVAVDPTCRRSGRGRMLVDHALKELSRRGCNKVNLQIRKGNEEVAAFYRTLGFAIEQRTSMGKEL
ncbi:MAG: GNAT family acetyltransferase [Pseudomonadota bacterium]